MEKLQNIYNQISFLLSQFKNINAKNLNALPKQIENMIVGENKIPLWLNCSIQVVTEDDLKGATSIPGYVFYNCTSLTEITIPKSITSIGVQTFYGCTSLESITIPDGVTSIGHHAFFSCKNLTDIYLNPTTPPTLMNTQAIPNTTTIHVPIGRGGTYKSATNWSYHSSRIVADIQL